MMADGPEQREAHYQEQSERDFERIQADEDRADEERDSLFLSRDSRPPRGTPKDIYHRVHGLARAVLSLMCCEGLTESEYATANEIWALAAMLENGREVGRNTHFQEPA